MFSVILFIILLVLVIGVVVGVVFFQLHLAKSESKWPGLVLPFLTFLFSIMSSFGWMLYDGTIEGLISIIIASLLFNIPTLILLAIYFSNRTRINNVSEIEKMTIQDLE